MAKIMLRSMSSAPKPKLDEEYKPYHSILLKLKNPIPGNEKSIFNGLWFVGRHPGIADNGYDPGWQFASPVGTGGWKDECFEGWLPLPIEYGLESTGG